MIHTLDELRPFLLSLAKPPKEMSIHEARAQFDELMSVMPERLEYFVGVLRGEGIDLQGSPSEALTRAGEWLVKLAKVVRVPSSLEPRFRETPTELDLSVPTISACCYLGYLFGEHVVESVPGARWDLVTGNKRDVLFHWPVVRPPTGTAQLEPTRVVMNYVRNQLGLGGPKRQLGDLFDYWRDAFASTKLANDS
jgi:hypothetical protein